MDKRITELTWQEWQEVIGKNQNLRNELYDLATDNANYWVEEYLQGFRGDYQIGEWGYSYVKIGDDYKDYLAFVEWYNDVQYAYELFYKEREIMDKYLAEVEKAYTGEDGVEFYEVWWEVKAKLEEIVVRRLTAEYKGIDTDVLLDFVDQWLDGEINRYEQEECYLDENFRIYQKVPERVIEAHVEYIA